ncbi:MAG TPA: PRC-barrel domain-containing protein [Gammaproteobacteria bacterium]|nr:PRC-barrel domain-containing protein [Gammaproteobacteria bacterium]
MNIQATKVLTLLVFAAAAAATMAASSWAQERPSAPVAQRGDATTLADWLLDKDARLSELIGRRVMNPNGTELGEVEDVLAKAGREQPVVVLSIGGVLDVGDKWHAASLDQLRLASDNERLVLDKTEAELKAAPNFDYVPMIGERSHQPGARGPNTTNSVGRLLGATVVDDAGDSIGEIKDFVVSTGERGTRAVVGLDEHVRAAEGRLVAVPFDALHIELSGEEARAVPLQARVRVELGGTPIEALPAYEYPARDVI